MKNVADMIRSTSYWSKLQVCFSNLNFYNCSIWLPGVNFRVIISLNQDLIVTPSELAVFVQAYFSDTK
jgi:hypothetical protein